MDDADLQVVDEIEIVDCVGKAIQFLLAPPAASSVCKWTDCDWPGADDDLVDHIREIHVELQPYGQQCATKPSASPPQAERFVCLWEGCKVYGKVSLSRSWLERHALAHSGPRPFKCIVDRCGARFKVRSALERHVNGHFACDFDESSLESETSNSKQRLSPARPRRRKSLRGKGRGVNLKSDFFDLSVMERLRFDLFQMSAHLGLERQVTFQGRVRPFFPVFYF